MAELGILVLAFVAYDLARPKHKLEAEPARPRYLLTEPGVGYRLAEE